MPDDAPQAPQDQTTRRDRQKRNAFERLPNAVARDPRYGAEHLVVIAYRCTIVGDWVLREADLKGLVRSGLGKNVARRVIAELQEFGVTTRWQLPGKDKGTFGKVCEKFNLQYCAEDESRIVRRSWFDKSLSAKDLGALFFLRAGVGKGGGGTYCRELMERFVWSRPSASKTIRVLVSRGLLDKVVTREAKGTFASTAYVVPQLAADGLRRSAHARVRPLSRIKRAGPAAPVEPAAGSAPPAEPVGWQTARDELLAVDHSRVLRPRLLTPRGIRPYLDMLERHGELARQTVKERITTLAIDGGRRGQVRGWAFFDGPIRDAVHRQQMAAEGLRPGDVLGSWRDRPVHDTPFWGE